jgi:cell wall assembly regulator SMI1
LIVGVAAVQKFTRALTREIELAGHRLKITLDEKGIALAPLGSRRPPREVSWAALVMQVLQGASEPEPGMRALAEAIEALKGSASGRKITKPASAPDRAEPAPPQELPALLARLETWLKRHRPRYAEALNPPATEDDIVALRGSLNAPVPDELRQLLAWHNGQSADFTGAFVENWLLLSAAEIGAAKSDLDAQIGARQSGWQPAWVPFLDDDGGNYLILDPSLPSVPVRDYQSTNPEAPTLAPSLTAWMREFVTAVEKGDYHEDPERGWFMKGSK